MEFEGPVDFDTGVLRDMSVKGGTSSNESYEPGALHKLDEDKLQKLVKLTKLPQDMYSDHIPTSRVVEGVEIVTFNASFVILSMQARLLNTTKYNELLISGILSGIGGKTHGSEGMAALAIAKKISTDLGNEMHKMMIEYSPKLPFAKFVNDVAKGADIILLQEWLSTESGKNPDGTKFTLNGGDQDGNEFTSNLLRMAGFTLFQTHSGFEGSCIAFKPGKCEDIIGGDVAQLNQNNFWAWCGVEGRTWSVVKCKSGERPFLCINIHGPNIGPDGTHIGPNGKPKYTVGPFKSRMHTYFGQAWFTKNGKEYNRFKSDIRTAHTIFLDALLKDEIPSDADAISVRAIKAIRTCYHDCEQRLAVGGDWNDAFVKVPSISINQVTSRTFDPEIAATTRV